MSFVCGCNFGHTYQVEKQTDLSSVLIVVECGHPWLVSNDRMLHCWLLVADQLEMEIDLGSGLEMKVNHKIVLKNYIKHICYLSPIVRCWRMTIGVVDF